MAGILTAFVGGSFGSAPPTYAVAAAAGATSVNEGSSLTFNVTGTNIVDGTYYWTVSATSDFATSSGSFTITSNAGSFSVTPTADTTTEGAETFTASVRTGSTSGTIVATSASITINDTSITPLTVWRLFEKPAEGSTFGSNHYLGGVGSDDKIYVWNSISSVQYITSYNSSGDRIEHYSYNASMGLPFSSGGNSSSGIGANLTVNTRTITPQAAQFYVMNSSSLATIDLQQSFTTTGSDEGGQAAKDSAGNWYLCVANASTSFGLTQLTKLNSSGVNQWWRSRAGSSSTTGYIGHTGAVCVDSTDNVYHAGYYGSGAGTNWVTKYNSSGTVQWRRTFTQNAAFSVKLYHHGGFIYVVSRSNNLIQIIKLDGNGTHQWTRTKATPVPLIDVTVNSYGILYTINNGSQCLWGILNLDGTSGNSWSIVNNSGTANSCYAQGAAWDSAGRIVVAGSLLRSTGEYYRMLIKHTTSQGNVSMGSINGGTAGTYSLSTSGQSWTTASTPTLGTTTLGSEGTTSMTQATTTNAMTAGSAAADTVLVSL